MLTTARKLTAIAIFAVGFTSADRAAAANGAIWTLDVPDTCGLSRDALEREVNLACAAVGTCRLVERGERAELKAALSCASETSWSLQMATVEGQTLSTVELTGATIADRLREAAVEIARDAAPERTLATETLHDTLDGDRLAPKEQHARGLVAVSGEGSVGTEQGLGAGGRAVGGVRVRPGFFAMLAAAGVAGTTWLDERRHLRGGAGIGLGAPFSEDTFGASFELGMDGSSTRVAPYAQAAVTAQIVTRSVRPFFDVSAIALAGPSLTFATGLGLAVPFF